MRVLVDRHHAGLYHSLQLLFEDRLGHTLCTPIGHEWWDAGIWRFGQVFGDDRLAQQYLVPGQPVMYDDEFPDRSIHGVTLAEAQGCEWGAVIATVQENQRGFHAFARANGAKFVVQVGNTGQQIDWSLDPLVINSSEMSGGVRIGQEFDSDGLFAYAPIAPRTRIASFVNCLPEICRDHGYIDATFRALDARYGVDVFGISGHNLKPIQAIRDAMHRTSWAYHDKPQGDGYGHVLHYWAALGRPLIGHGHHYNGKNGAAFWVDGVTCIDLDKHSLDEAIALIDEITHDRPRYLAMCRAIRDVFDQTTNWQADAEAVRRLLE